MCIRDSFTDIQMYIYEKCPHDELTIIMRRYMMRIAQKLAIDTGCLALITGESIGQVASQTVQSLAATNDVCTLPVFRPLLAFDKEDIVTISKKINTYETSILPVSYTHLSAMRWLPWRRNWDQRCLSEVSRACI